MFKELGPLLRQRTVVMILTRLEDDTIRVNVIPRKLNESENDALTTPLSVAGTAEELDAQLPSALVQFVGAHLELKNTLETAKEQMAAAGKAAKAEARSKTAAKTAPVRNEPAGAETKKPAEATPKPVEPRKQEPERNASLFDTGTAPASTPLSASEADEDEETLAEADDEPTEEPDDLDEAA
jgi:PRTRC genetic system protein E